MTQNGITDAVVLVQQRRTMKTGILFSPFGSEQNDEYILSAIKSAGFDSFFSDARCNEEKIRTLKLLSEKIGLTYESVHAPFGGINVICRKGKRGTHTQKSSAALRTSAKNTKSAILHCIA